MKKTAANHDVTTDLPAQADLEETAVLRSGLSSEIASPDADAWQKVQTDDVSRRVGLVLGSGPSMSEESHERLRKRLQLSSLLLGCGLGFYLIIKLLNPVSYTHLTLPTTPYV